MTDFDAVARLVRRGDLAALEALGDWDVNQDDGVTGTTALLIACETGQAEVVRHLLERGADPNRVHRDGWNCYDPAGPEIRDLLVRHGFDLRIWQPTQGRGLEALRVLSPARAVSGTWRATVADATLEYRTDPTSGNIRIKAGGLSIAVDHPTHHRTPIPSPSITVTFHDFRGEARIRLFCEAMIGDPREFWLPSWDA